MAEKGYVGEFHQLRNAVEEDPVDIESDLLQLTHTAKVVHSLIWH